MKPSSEEYWTARDTSRLKGCVFRTHKRETRADGLHLATAGSPVGHACPPQAVADQERFGKVTLFWRRTIPYTFHIFTQFSFRRAESPSAN
jgi:hypothetical protein